MCPGFIPVPGVICGFSLLLVLFLAPRGFSPGTPVFLSPQKPIFPNSNSIWIIVKHFIMSLARVIAQALPVIDIKLAFTFLHLHLQCKCVVKLNRSLCSSPICGTLNFSLWIAKVLALEVEVSSVPQNKMRPDFLLQQ